ncbi:MAG: isoprenylcysteine carboxylmethyltransferase family protein [Hyphomicrobiales bacterium]|nr:isoprenylcysteine carboxylmethyltransferase family protein [Hyphomicrobiales bacterium]
MTTVSALAITALAWLSFGLLHSLLASRAGRFWLQGIAGPAGRLAYNGIAIVHLALVLGISAFAFAGEGSFNLPAPLRLVLHILQLAGLVGLVMALREYDLGRFSGWQQWRAGTADDPDAAAEPLVVSGLHRYVRHPLYSTSILLLLASATTPLALATALFASAYFIIGLRFEETRLLRLYGAAYRDYRATTPALLPNWR